MRFFTRSSKKREKKIFDAKRRQRMPILMRKKIRIFHVGGFDGGKCAPCS